jgi:hypothetical protein
MGIAVGLALALTAFVGVAQASANMFKVGSEPATWSGARLGKEHQLWLGEEEFGCENVSFTAETTKKSVSELTVTPELSGCIHLNGIPTSFAMHGCKFRFHPGAGPALVGTMDITGCEKPITYEAGGCRDEIGDQSGLGPVTYRNTVVEGVSRIVVTASLSGITYTRTSSQCGNAPGTFSNGTYTGEWTVKGATKPGGAPAGVEVESTPAPPITKFAAEEAPVTIAGLDSSVGKKISGIGTVLLCQKFSLSGTLASVTSETITAVPTYSGCRFNEEAVPDSSLSAGGCSYVFHVNGKFDIAGASCASKPITLARSGCVVTIGPQSGLSTSLNGLKYTNEGSGRLRAVSLNRSGSIESVTYTATGESCPTQGTFSTGIISVGNLTLTATNSKGAAQGLWVE